MLARKLLTTFQMNFPHDCELAVSCREEAKKPKVTASQLTSTGKKLQVVSLKSWEKKETKRISQKSWKQLLWSVCNHCLFCIEQAAGITVPEDRHPSEDQISLNWDHLPKAVHPAEGTVCLSVVIMVVSSSSLLLLCFGSLPHIVSAGWGSQLHNLHEQARGTALPPPHTHPTNRAARSQSEYFLSIHTWLHLLEVFSLWQRGCYHRVRVVPFHSDCYTFPFSPFVPQSNIISCGDTQFCFTRVFCMCRWLASEESAKEVRTVGEHCCCCETLGSARTSCCRFLCWWGSYGFLSIFRVWLWLCGELCIRCKTMCSSEILNTKSGTQSLFTEEEDNANLMCPTVQSYTS